MLREVRERVGALMRSIGNVDELGENNIVGIVNDIIWIVRSCTMPRLRYYPALNSVLEALTVLYERQKLDQARNLLLTILRRILEELLVIMVGPEANTVSYRFMLRDEDIDPEKILEITDDLCLSILETHSGKISVAGVRVAVAYIYTLVMIISAGIRDGRQNIPGRLIKNINIVLGKIIGDRRVRVVMFSEIIEQIAFRGYSWGTSVWRDLRLISKTIYRMNYVVNLLASLISHNTQREVNIDELSINGFQVDFGDGHIDTRTTLHGLQETIESIGEKIVGIVKDDLSRCSIGISESTRVFLDNIISYLKSLTTPEVANSLDHNLDEIINDLANNSKLRRIVTVLLSIITTRQAIMKRLPVSRLLSRPSNTRQHRDKTHTLQIICLGNDTILKNILEYPIYHTDGHRYSVFSYGPGTLDVNIRASRILVLRYMYPIRHEGFEEARAGRITLHDLYNGNIDIPWIEIRISRIASNRTSIYLRSRERNIYEGHIEFRLSPRHTPIWTPGWLTLIAFMLLTSPVYEKMMENGIAIEELSIEVRCLGSQDIQDPLVLPKLCNNILRLLQKMIHRDVRRIITLTPLGGEIRLRFLINDGNGRNVIHIDVLPLILEQSGRAIYGIHMRVLDTLIEYMSKYRLELIDTEGKA